MVYFDPQSTHIGTTLRPYSIYYLGTWTLRVNSCRTADASGISSADPGSLGARDVDAQRRQPLVLQGFRGLGGFGGFRVYRVLGFGGSGLFGLQGSGFLGFGVLDRGFGVRVLGFVIIP